MLVSLFEMGLVVQAKSMPPIDAWYYNPNSVEDPEEKDPTLPHHFSPDQQVSREHLECTD